ncbi:MAG: amino acid decarboxylase [Eubacterium sp.]|jgi:arginine/lysine/ornithine decarboxylase|nr:amino acid decarboxylase [Eubacterium sp.]
MCSDKLALTGITTPIADFLRCYKEKEFLRCHMPGGKNNPSDITEIFGADSLYESNGIIAESEQNAAALFGGGAVCYSCSGSTLCVQAMLSFIRRQNGCLAQQKIIAGRYSHRSLISSAITMGLEIEWIYPAKYLSASISSKTLEATLRDKAACAVFLTGIDYYGGECDIKAASEICENNNIPLLVDNAHGAYKVFTGNHPINLGARFSADSAHKTLPVLTGGGYLNIKSLSELPEIKKEMALFGTASPSYLILESLDVCNIHIKNEKHKAIKVFNQVCETKSALAELGFAVCESDALRIVINARECGYTGFEMAEKLREKKTECEMCDDSFVILLFSTTTNDYELKRLTEILKNIPIKARLSEKEHTILKPEAVLPPRKAYYKKRKKVAIKSAAGRICAEILAPCPPGVPLVMPGERIDKDCIEELIRYGFKDEIDVIF